jgi:hypothetical protein
MALFLLSQTLWMTARAQEVPPIIDLKHQEQPAPDPAITTRKFPLEVAGFLYFRGLNDDDLDHPLFTREYSGSVFLSRSIRRWLFHSEFNASNAPEYDSEGIHLFPHRLNLSVKLDSASVNYNWRDWLQPQAGFLFMPTYWRTHRYQSTTLTVDEPLVDQNVFPTAFKGVMIHGDKYWEDGGISYQVYGGISQEEEFENDVHALHLEKTPAVGGRLTLHVPTRHLFDNFDVSFQRLHRANAGGKRDEISGAEIQLKKGRAEFLAEFAYSAEDVLRGSAEYFRQGYYLQPSYRITSRLFAVIRYDRLNRDSRFADERGLARQLAGLTYRPVPDLSLKVEADRYEPQHGRLPAYYGASVGVVYFFRLP